MAKYHKNLHKELCMANIKITLSLPSETVSTAEKLGKELHISKSEVYDRAMKLLAKEHRMARIRQACEFMADEYKTDLDLKIINDFVGDFRETI